MSDNLYVPMRHIHVSSKYSHFIPEDEQSMHDLAVSCKCTPLIAVTGDCTVMFHHGVGWHWEEAGDNDFVQKENS